MDKDNQFKSCSFYLATDDVVHIRVKDLVGVGFTVELNDANGTAEDETEVTPYGAVTSIEYGALYNWYAVADARNICAEGWHIPTSAEITTLLTYIGGDAIAGGKLKEAGVTYWDNPNSGAGNDFGFNGRGAGSRLVSGGLGVFADIRKSLYIWTSDENDVDTAYVALLGFYLDDAAVWPTTDYKYIGYSLRPIKDSTTLIHGQSSLYADPSGYIYRTICIGTQEFVASNIKTEHFRNGDAIPVVTDNAAWAALSTAGMCYYNNDITYV